jgi:acetyl-CoA/propionyl-CoA carboxylase biotin carboxyl carrier protein
VAVYSEADRESLHVRFADDDVCIGPPPSRDSYLKIPRIIAAAEITGADAIHPGYGFLAENAEFAETCAASNITFIGPSAEQIRVMGDKAAARKAMSEVGVPIIPGTPGPVEDVDEALEFARQIGFPVIIKAAAGGGGKGMKLVEAPDGAERAFASARREGEKYFADERVYVERYLVDPRHVEVQVLADAHGNVVHLGERDCTIQRRHQKLVEETPSPAVDDELRQRIGAIAVDAARAAGYRSAGTIEGLLTAEREYFFMEMNTRIQVEHTVTEEVTGVDLVREQVLIAAGEPLSFRQEDVRLHGHAIECRINAEDASSGFLPSPGRITHYREPAGPGVRVDSGVVAGSEISGLYDPMIAKLIVHGVDREHARMRMLRALEEFELAGTPTLLGFHRALLSHPCFVAGETCHGIVESPELAAEAAALTKDVSDSPSLDGRAVRPEVRVVEVGGKRFDVTVLAPEPPWLELARRRQARRTRGPGGAGSEAVVSPMQGTVLKVEVADGDEIEAGRVLCVVEAMKMENEITAHRRGTVADLSVAAGDAVSSGQVICRVVGE